MLVGCRHLGPAEVAGKLYDLGAYPAVVVGDEGIVQGELWECPDETVAALDAYEGVGEELFRRVRVKAGAAECWIYVAGPRLEPVLTPERVIADGIWRTPGSRPGPP